jgi:hypothetical protein
MPGATRHTQWNEWEGEVIFYYWQAHSSTHRNDKGEIAQQADRSTCHALIVLLDRLVCGYA